MHAYCGGGGGGGGAGGVKKSNPKSLTLVRTLVQNFSFDPIPG